MQPFAKRGKTYEPETKWGKTRPRQITNVVEY